MGFRDKKKTTGHDQKFIRLKDICDAKSKRMLQKLKNHFPLGSALALSIVMRPAQSESLDWKCSTLTSGVTCMQA